MYERKDDNENEIIGMKELYELLPFGAKKVQRLIRAGELPMVKVGRSYITTRRKLYEWIEENIGQELYY